MIGNPKRASRGCRKGAALLIAVFVVALVSALVIGILQINTEEIQFVHNHIYMAQALATAEAGLNDALSKLRADADWDAGFMGEPFDGGSYTVVFDGATILSTGATSRGFAAAVEADVTVSPSGPPHAVTVDALRINP